MAIDPARHEHERYLLELLGTTAKTVERTIRRLDQDMTSDRETLHLILRELCAVRHDLESQPSPTSVTLSRFSAVRFSPPQ